MKISRKVTVRPLTRVEGHGNIHITIRDGKVREARWENAPWICGRICGICSIGHTLASIRAVESAFGIIPSDQTRKLRLLLKHMETLQSHILHLYFLAAPDFLNAGSVFPLIKSDPDIVNRAAGMKLLANDACDLIGGRRIHPTRTVVGGFTMLPEKKELEILKQRLEDSADDLARTAETFRSFPIPDFSRETEFVSLKGEEDYPFIGGDLISTDGVQMKEKAYAEMTNEYTVKGSTAKWARLSRSSFAVGALARANNNFRFLHSAAKELAESFGLKPVNHNPFMNNIAQLVECVHVTLDSIKLINELLDSTWEEPRRQVKPRKGTGVGAVEVPRGILYHSYEFDRGGRIVKSDCVIPTGQNHANIFHDIEGLASKYASGGMKDTDIELMAEMLVRSYDPCISCSVH